MQNVIGMSHQTIHSVRKFDWESAPWFDANGLNDVAPMQASTVVEGITTMKTFKEFMQESSY